MRYLFILFISGSLLAQSNPFSALTTETFEPISDDSLTIKTLSMLSQVGDPSILNRNPLDIEYNWTKDIRRTDFYNRMAFDVRKVDICGREYLPDAFRDATFSALTKTSPASR